MISHGEPGDALWRKSTKSPSGADCVSIASANGGVLIRDSKDPTAAVIQLSRETLRDFILAAKAGAFDL